MPCLQRPGIGAWSCISIRGSRALLRRRCRRQGRGATPTLRCSSPLPSRSLLARVGPRFPIYPVARPISPRGAGMRPLSGKRWANSARVVSDTGSYVAEVISSRATGSGRSGGRTTRDCRWSRRHTIPPGCSSCITAWAVSTGVPDGFTPVAGGERWAAVIAPDDTRIPDSRPTPWRRVNWSGRGDLNPRPQRPERCALPSCATPRRRPIVASAMCAVTRVFHGAGSRCTPYR